MKNLIILIGNNTYENMANLPSNYVEELQRTYTGDELKRYLYGEWGSVSNEWSVWQNYRSGLHVAKDAIEPVVGLPIIRAWDFGMRASCLCAQLLGKQLRFIRPEVMEFNKGAEQFVPIVLGKQSQLFHGYRFYDLSDQTFVGNRSIVDSHKSCKSVLLEHGVRIVGGTMQWDKRYSAVDWFLTTLDNGQPAMQIDPACDYLIGGFEGGYKFRENASERRAEDVIKNEYSEVHDCAQHIAVFARKMLKTNYEEEDVYRMPMREEKYAFGIINGRR
jgi:hypothetical protein